MALATEIMQGGLSAGTAIALGGQVNSTITASSTQTQVGATALSTSINVITTVVTTGDAVRVMNAMIGDEILILNLGANACTIFPPVGSRINALSTNTGFTLATNTAVQMNKFTATRWVAFLSA
jgi:hypothetical protein